METHKYEEWKSSVIASKNQNKEEGIYRQVFVFSCEQILIAVL